MTKLFFEQIIKPKAGLGEPDEPGREEAMKFARRQFKMLNRLFNDTRWLANDTLSIADLFAIAYVEQVRAIDYSIDEYSNVNEWFNRMESRDSISRARARLPS